jgi:osmotically-inducible protein OsmY
MKLQLALSIACLPLLLGAVSCKNTVEGAEQDAIQNTEVVQDASEKAAAATKKSADDAAAATQQATDRAVSATSKMGKNVGDALGLTPQIKRAITDDKELNNTSNRIDVDTEDNTVTLKGYVLSEAMKQRAGRIAQKAMENAGSKNALVNELKIKNR